MLFHNCNNVTWSWAWCSNRRCERKGVFIKLMPLIAQSHLLLMSLRRSKGHFLVRLLSELFLVFSLSYKCSYVHLEARAPHVTGSLTCAPCKGAKTVNKKGSLWELEISCFKCNPQDFLQEIMDCFCIL